MSTLKEFLNISSFSHISGVANPPNTCPMIDRVIKDHQNSIETCKEEISSLKDKISDLEDEITDDKENELSCLYNEKQIQRFNTEIEELEYKNSEYQSQIDSLEEDRQNIVDLRAIGHDARKDFLSLLDESLCTENKIWFTHEIKDFLIDPYKTHLPSIKSDERDIYNNYLKILEFTEFWMNPYQTFHDFLLGNVFIIDKELNFSHSYLKSHISIFMNRLYLSVDTQEALKEAFSDYIVTDTFYISENMITNDNQITTNESDENGFFVFKGSGLDLTRLYDDIGSFSKMKPSDIDYFIFNKDECIVMLNEENETIKSLVTGDFYNLDMNVLSQYFPDYISNHTVFTDHSIKENGFYSLKIHSDDPSLEFANANVTGFNLLKFCEDYHLDNISGTDIVHLYPQDIVFDFPF